MFLASNFCWEEIYARILLQNFAGKKFNVSSTNSTLCAQPCYHQTVETHSCVSASCQVFAIGDFIRQSCLPRRKNASLHLGYTQDIQAISRPTQMSGFVAAPHLVFRYETHSTTNQKAWCSGKNYSFPISSSSRIHYPLIDSSRTWQLDA